MPWPQRSLESTREEHLDDHNDAHDLLNVLEGSTVPSRTVTASADLAADFVNGSANSYTTFHSLSHVPQSSRVKVDASVAGSTSINFVDLQLLVGASARKLGRLPVAASVGVARTVVVDGLTPGVAVTVALQYAAGATGTFSCRPATQNEHASITIQDVA